VRPFDLGDLSASTWGLAGLGYLLMWIGSLGPGSVWFLGLLVSLADLIRPKPDA